MTAIDTLLAAPTGTNEPQRDKFGRPYVHYPNETKPRTYTRVTTLAGTLSDRWALEQWSNRMVALGIAQRRDLYAAAAALTADDKKQLDDIAKQAKEAAGASAGASIGTALHKLTERLDAGEPVDAPEPWNHDLDAYRQALQAHGIEIIPAWLEQFMVCPAVGVAGTADRIVKHQGRLRISDLKTGSFLNWGEIAIQLACYANAETHYDPATKTHTPAPDVDKQVGLVIHLPAGKAHCTIYEIDLTQGWEWAKTAAAVREWRKAKPAKALKTPALVTQPVTIDQQRVDWLRTRLLQLKNDFPQVLETVAQNWPLGVPTFTTDHTHTPDELTAIELVIRDAEAAHRVPFPDTNRPRSSTELIGRIRQLPADTIHELERRAAAEQIPALSSPKTTGAHLDRLDQLISPLEQVHQARVTRIEAALRTAVDDDAAMGAALVETVTMHRETGSTSDVNTLTGPETDALVAVCQAVHDGLIVMIAADSADAPIEWILDVKDPGETLDLLLTGRTKSLIRDQGKQAAEQLSFGSKPRSAADVASDPILTAIIHATPTNQTTNNNSQTKK